MSFHKDLKGNDLHGIKPKEHEGNPVGFLDPEYIGEVIVDTVSNSFYRATGISNNDWTLVGGEGDLSSISELSDVSTVNREDETILEWNASTQLYEHIPDMQGKSAGVLGTAPTI